jgi:hypothetical protein
MVESPQTVKNWETRGISRRGAMKAQAVFGCNANELLATETDIAVSGIHLASENLVPYLASGATDPWTQAAVEIMQSLDEAGKQGMLARMREFKQYLEPSRTGRSPPKSTK